MMRWAVLVAVLGAATACAVRIAQLDELAVDAGPEPRAATGAAEGRHCRWWILGVPLGLPRIDAAAREALAQHSALMLRDVEVTSEHPTWGPVGQHCYRVRGTAWR